MVHADRPFVDTPPGPPEATLKAADVAASVLGLPAPEPLRTGMNALFTCGDVIVRVGRTNAPAGMALVLAHYLADAGIPVPAPASDQVLEIGDLSVTTWQRIEPTAESVDWRAVGLAVARLHQLPPLELPPAVPLPFPNAFPWWRFDEMLNEARPELDPEAFIGLEAAIERRRGWFDPDRLALVVCHGDVHPGNVMMSADGVVLLDWDLICLGPPAWDHAPMMTWATRWGGRPGEYEAFAAGYGRSMRGDGQAEAIAELRLVAATLMRVLASRQDPAAKAEAERRLQYWRGEPDAPQWTAQ
jgi:Ser/Thr protein kinase RdoA (MazF antagonist)